MSHTETRSRYRAFEEQLRAQRDELKRSTREQLEELGENTLAKEVGDIGDHALASWMDELREADLRHEIAEVRDIDAALNRIEAGTYGTCMECGEEIPEERLRAWPTAKRCQPCQVTYEERSPQR